MAIQSKLAGPPSADTVVDHTLLAPWVTGSLLAYIHRNPGVSDRVPWFPPWTLRLPFRLPFVGDTVTLRAHPPVKTLRVLFAAGLVLWTNRLLNKWALNHWHLGKPGVPWRFDTPGHETIVITGGCSGFGREMAQMFAAHTQADVVVLDIQDLPAELKDRK
jgi:hypothetical protein